MGIALVPGVGGPLQVVFNELAGRRLEERRSRWFGELAAKIHRLEAQVGNFEELTSKDAFMDALTTASHIADRTSRAEKLEALRNAVVNSVMPDAPDDDTQQLMFDMIDRFTPTHLRMLELLCDPPGWFDRHGIARPSFMGPKTGLIEAGMPELASRRDLIDRYGGALTGAGLIGQSLSGTMTENGLWAAATTSLGVEFLVVL